ncbi:diacylglycerol/lipid kinase family protein [Fodinibius sp.]|uniref:diacylglycerol/lipid kinase family protein n=1 Tax=Fodinibius sp. TaxID=1872440 RepID=UPI002ACEF66D|nr:YegS/Rv2252/BmrU family lipid kinase [Fodinibius sp.]MDZ7660215.1 YegS/Rv2252/BmrU family lipid kinase [Fodinibius sp.]
MKRYAFLYNPAAQGGKSGVKLERLREFISEFEDACLFHSQDIGDITDFIEQNFDEFDVFVACGGDGTVREVAATLINTHKQMGIIPLGTGNDLCKTLNIPVKLEQSFSVLKQENAVSIDVGQCNNFIFLNSLGFGFDGLTNRYALQLKHLHPFLTYAISALKAVINHTSFEVTIIKKENISKEHAIMFSLANGRVEGGSFWIAPNASITDGKLNAILIKPIAKWIIPVLLPLFLFKKSHLIPQVKSAKIEKLSLNFNGDVDIHADGEVIENRSNKFIISLEANALEVICPPTII